MLARSRFMPSTTNVSFERAFELLTPPSLPFAHNMDIVEQQMLVQYSEEQRAVLEDIPFSEEVLRSCQGTHILFPGFKLSIAEMRKKFPDLFYGKAGNAWWDAQAFATTERVPPRWYLLRKEPVPGSFNKTWKEQQLLLPADEETPRTCEVIYGMLLHFLVTGERFFPDCYVRTADVDVGGGRVGIGVFGAGGLSVYNYWDDDRHDDLGVAARRQSL
jgi:hypothetical protein